MTKKEDSHGAKNKKGGGKGGDDHKKKGGGHGGGEGKKHQHGHEHGHEHGAPGEKKREEGTTKPGMTKKDQQMVEKLKSKIEYHESRDEYGEADKIREQITALEERAAEKAAVKELKKNNEGEGKKKKDVTVKHSGKKHPHKNADAKLPAPVAAA